MELHVAHKENVTRIILDERCRQSSFGYRSSHFISIPFHFLFYT